MTLTAEAKELLSLHPNPVHIAEALDGIEKVLLGFELVGGQWNRTGIARSICVSNDVESAFRRLVSARDGLRSVLAELSRGST